LATWDVFRSDRLEVERGLSTAQVRAALARGELRDDDLIRPAGTSSGWTPLAEMPALLAPEPEAEAQPGPHGRAEAGPAPADSPSPAPAPPLPAGDEPPVFPADEAEADVEAAAPAAETGAYSEFDLRLRDRDRDPDGGANGAGSSSHEVLIWDDDLDGPEEYDPQDEDEEAAEFTLSRGGPETVEELDLAAMVDVAFQLVLFFLVTAEIFIYKTLEVPRPNPESNPAATAQGRTRTPDDLKNDFILVDIDPAGGVKIDREPVASEMSALVERLREARERTGRKAMLLSADFTTPHRNAVLAYDAANEIGRAIAIARPAPPAQSPAPTKAAGAGG
jgi:biopolymer transport protein ExbD